MRQLPRESTTVVPGAMHTTPGTAHSRPAHFDTGYCSLAHLQPFPLYAVKIDRPFIAGLAHSHEVRRRDERSSGSR
jgi:hypothetical protein